MSEFQCEECKRKGEVGHLEQLSLFDTCTDENGKNTEYYNLVCSQCLKSFIGVVEKKDIEDRIDKQMYELSLVLCSELDEYINHNYEDDFQGFLDSKFSIGGYITELSELLKEF
ncbi:hypothetical protein [uncultured Clostridium sp.]|jgi:hypothetical protein|uniref:hypothetical protein n=1 Tax=uncultured Clostridium sp. TaxID=59620 RepID=UPI00260177DB|nr:hypothetical protein [uncultured Clostridium sp.]